MMIRYLLAKLEPVIASDVSFILYFHSIRRGKQQSWTLQFVITEGIFQLQL